MNIETSSQNTPVILRAITTCLADVKPQEIKWLWPGRIALGKLTLIAGDPGLGKSLLTAALAAHISNGSSWPVDGTEAPLGGVILLSAEDDPADTIRPRLDAAGAEPSVIHVLYAVRDKDNNGSEIQRSFSLKRDITVLEELLTKMPECRLIVIDPISAYLDGTESHNNSDVRGLLLPISDLARKHGVAIVAISHLNKSTGGNAMYRTMGSLAFTAAARAAYVVTKDQDNPNRRLLLPVKNNLAKDDTGLAYSVVTAENGAPVIAWEPLPVSITASEALSDPNDNRDLTNTDWAVDFLLDLLADGPVPAAKVKSAARKNGFNDKPLRRAQERLGIKPKKSTFEGGWEWALPNIEDALSLEDARSENKGVLVDEGQLAREINILN